MINMDTWDYVESSGYPQNVLFHDHKGRIQKVPIIDHFILQNTATCIAYLAVKKTEKAI